MGIIQKATTKLISKIANKKSNKTSSNKNSEEVIIPDKKSVVVTDFSDGSSIKTETSTSGSTGETTTTRTYRGSGGRNATPEQQKTMEFQKTILDLQQEEKRKLTPQTPIDTTTERGRKLNRDLGSLSTENTAKEMSINEQTTAYIDNRATYYQDLVNRRKLTPEQATNRLKKDAEAYQQQLIDAENRRRERRYYETLNENDVVYIGEFGDLLFKGDVTPIQDKKAKIITVAENVKTFVVEKGTKGVNFLKKINWIDDVYEKIPNPEISVGLYGIEVGKKPSKYSIPLEVAKSGAVSNIEKMAGISN